MKSVFKIFQICHSEIEDCPELVEGKYKIKNYL